MQPVQLDVFYPLPEGWGLCLTCEAMLAQARLDEAPAERGMDQYPEDYREEVDRLANWVYEIAGRFGEQIAIRVHDPRSPRGMWKALRSGARRYPAFVISKEQKVSGWDRPRLEAMIEGAVASTEASPAGWLEEKAGMIWPRLRDLARVVYQMFYGMTVYEMVRDLHKERGKIERMFILIVFGDLLGLPILPPYYTLRLLPYVVPNINAWKHSLLRERDLTDLCDQEIT